jgi:hypothetical protein
MINKNSYIWEITREAILKNIESMKISKLMQLFNSLTKFQLQQINITNATNLLVHFSRTWKCNFTKLNSKMKKIFRLNFHKLKMHIRELLMKFIMLKISNKIL